MEANFSIKIKIRFYGLLMHNTKYENFIKSIWARARKIQHATKGTTKFE